MLLLELYPVNFKNSEMDEMRQLFAILTMGSQMQKRNLIELFSVFCVLFRG